MKGSKGTLRPVGVSDPAKVRLQETWEPMCDATGIQSVCSPRRYTVWISMPKDLEPTQALSEKGSQSLGCSNERRPCHKVYIETKRCLVRCLLESPPWPVREWIQEPRLSKPRLLQNVQQRAQGCGPSPSTPESAYVCYRISPDPGPVCCDSHVEKSG